MQLTDAGLIHVRNHRRLIRLGLTNTAVSDAGIKSLSGLTNLNTLDLHKTRVTEAGVKNLSAALPKCRIEWDGGVIEYSTTGLAGPWLDLGPMIEKNGYDGTLAPGGSNTIKGRPAFVDESQGYLSSRVDLSLLAGEEVRIRFRVGEDSVVVLRVTDSLFASSHARHWSAGSGPAAAPTSMTERVSDDSTE